jgi:hypothetical protein
MVVEHVQFCMNNLMSVQQDLHVVPVQIQNTLELSIVLHVTNVSCRDVIDGGGGGGGHRGVAASAPAVAEAKLPICLDPTEWEWPEATVCLNEFPLLRLCLRGFL